MTPPLDVNTMARAASYSDIRDFFGSGAESYSVCRVESLGHDSTITVETFSGGNSGNSTFSCHSVYFY